MERVLIDLKEYNMYTDENDGYCYQLSVIDHYSNYSWTAALKTKTAEEVAHHLFKIFRRYGPPTLLHSDNGGEFVNKVCN